MTGLTLGPDLFFSEVLDCPSQISWPATTIYPVSVLQREVPSSCTILLLHFVFLRWSFAMLFKVALNLWAQGLLQAGILVWSSMWLQRLVWAAIYVAESVCNLSPPLPTRGLAVLSSSRSPPLHFLCLFWGKPPTNSPSTKKT